MSFATEPRAEQPRTISNPDEPASAAMLALMKRFKIRGKKGLTRGEAHARIKHFFDTHPDERNAYEAERKGRNQNLWRQLVQKHLKAAKDKRGDRHATEGQIGGLMRRAFGRPQGDRLRIEILSALNIGASSAQADVLIRRADGTFKERPQPGSQAA